MRTDRQPDTSTLTEYDEAIRLNPNAAEAYFNRGRAKVKLDQRPAAITDYDEAIRLNPNFAEAYLHRGYLKDYLAIREPLMAACHSALRSAIADFDAAIRLGLEHSDLFHAYYRRGEAKYNLDRYAAAIVDFNEAIKLNPNHSELLDEVLDARKEAEGILKFYEEGIAGMAERIRQNPNAIRDYKIRGESNGFLGRMQAAKSDFQKVLELTTDTHIIAEIERHLQELDNPDYWQQYSWRTGD